MPYDPDRHHRRSIRLRGFDYSQAGAYFVTVCTQDRYCYFGQISDGQMQLNDAGRMVWAEWHALPTRFPGIQLDEFVVMPNHVHAVVWIVGAPLVGARSPDGADGATTGAAPAGVVGAPLVGARSPDRADGATTGAAPTGVVGAPLVGARSPDGADGATTGAAPAGVVGAPLVGAQSPDGADGATTRVAPTGARCTIGDVIGAFKSITTNGYIQGVNGHHWATFPGRLWQRNYYEQVIRNDETLNRIRQYIVDNPAQWADDDENPEKGRR
jgi:putative transposase